MPSRIDRDEAQRLLADNAQLVEVLPAEEYGEEHIAGAVNIPLKELREGAKQLSEDRPIVVYCHDHQCDVSARAASRLETMGFTKVYDYVAGKMDWSAAGLPIEGRAAEKPCARNAMRTDVSSCGITDSVGDAISSSGGATCAATNESKVVLGFLRQKRLEQPSEMRIEDAMQEGPSTYRPNVPLDELAPRMERAGVRSVLITNPEGQLLGIVYLEDAKQLLIRGKQKTAA